MNPLWYGISGPNNSPVVLVGESWGSDEKAQQRPFVGTSGIELNRILTLSGLDRNAVLCTNVVAAQPPLNETFRFCHPKEGLPSSVARIGGIAPTHMMVEECRRLYRQIAAHPRDLVIVTGNWPLWALTTSCTSAKIVRESSGRAVPTALQTWVPAGIMNWRGSMWYVEPRPEFASDLTEEELNRLQQTKLLPIIHPAAIMRQWALRDITIHDLRTRVPQARSNTWHPPDPTIVTPLEGSKGDYSIVLDYLYPIATTKDEWWIASDVETNSNHLTCAGFAISPQSAISIPFVRDGMLSPLWSTDREARIVDLCRRIFLNPNVRIVGQNYLYDTQYFQTYWGVSPVCAHDTMLAQNVLFPGTDKDLGTLSSLYCDNHWYWKDDGKEWNTKGSIQDLLTYNAWDCLRTHEIAGAQRRLLEHCGLVSQMSLKMYIHHLCLRMMNKGVRIDMARRARVAQELRSFLAQVDEELLTIVPQEWVKPHKKLGEAFWITSDKQTKTLFYDLLGFRIVTDRKTKNPTTGKAALRIFKTQRPEFSGLINRLDLRGSAEEILQVTTTALESNFRLSCSYNPGGTETHRLSSSKNAFKRGTNLQNLTTGKEE